MCRWGSYISGDNKELRSCFVLLGRVEKKEEASKLFLLLFHSVVLFHGGKKIVEGAEGDVVSSILSLAACNVSVGLVGEARCFRKGFFTSTFTCSCVINLSFPFLFFLY